MSMTCLMINYQFLLAPVGS